MLALALVGMLVAVTLLLLELSRYNFDFKATGSGVASAASLDGRPTAVVGSPLSVVS